MDLGIQGGQDLGEAVDEMQVAFAGVEASPAVGNGRGEMAGHGDGIVGVLLTVPQVHRDLDVRKAESPRARVQAQLPGGPPTAAAERLRQRRLEDLPQLW